MNPILWKFPIAWLLSWPLTFAIRACRLLRMDDSEIRCMLTLHRLYNWTLDEGDCGGETD